MMELHSESESDRAVLAFRGPLGEAATVIVMRKNGKVWMVFNGALKTTVAMSDAHAGQLTEAVTAASRRSS
jgi:streptogramin lyase